MSRYWIAPLLFALLVWNQAAARAPACELCSRFSASMGTKLPESDFADQRDDDWRAPIYADGSPGQYTLIGSQWPQPDGPGTTVKLTYSFQNMFDGALKMPNGEPLPADLIRGSIEEALGLWASVAPLEFVEVPDDGSQFGQIRFRHLRINGPDPVVGAPVAKARAYFPSLVGDAPGDVEFDDGDAWQEIGTLGQPDILGAAIHEIGHTLGLGHSLGVRPDEYWTYQQYSGTGQLIDVLEPKGNANMFWIFTRYSGLGTGELFPDDIAGIRAIYGEGTGSVTSLVPEPASCFLASVIALIWLTVSRRTHE